MIKHPLSERIIESGALQRVPEVVGRYSKARAKLAIVCDDATYQAAGKAVAETLPNAAVLNLGPTLKAEMRVVKELAQQAKEYAALIAVGSGTINDLSKYAAHQLGISYVAVATATSMNGYSSASASLIDEGLKHSFAAAPPRAVIGDIEVLRMAPRRLLRAGVGDTLCRTTVEADMILSEAVAGTPYPREIFDTLRARETELTASLANGHDERKMLTVLMHALLDGGDAMHQFGSSAVASQGEHMIAHTIELMYGSEIYDVLHGEMIAITSNTMNRLQHKLLLGTPLLSSLPREKDVFLRSMGKALVEDTYKRYHEKVLDARSLTERVKEFQARWPETRNRLKEIMLPTTTLERLLTQVGMSVNPSAASIDEERYRNACTYAYLSRERFGFLDLAVMNGKRVS